MKKNLTRDTHCDRVRKTDVLWATSGVGPLLGSTLYKFYTYFLSLIEMPEFYIKINFIKRIFIITEKFKMSERIDFIIFNNTNNINSCIETIETSL